MTLSRLLALPLVVLWNALFWTYDRATWQYDLMVIAILAFVWLTPPAWAGAIPWPPAPGLLAWLLALLS